MDGLGDHLWPPSKVGEVAKGRPTEGAPPTGVESVGRRQCPSPAQRSRRQGKFGGRTIARSCCRVGRRQSVVRNVAGSPSQCRHEVQGSPGERERVEACKGFIERAKKRFVRIEAVIAKAHEQKLIFEAELREGEACLLQVQGESEAQSTGPSQICEAKWTS